MSSKKKDRDSEEVTQNDLNKNVNEIRLSIISLKNSIQRLDDRTSKIDQLATLKDIKLGIMNHQLTCTANRQSRIDPRIIVAVISTTGLLGVAIFELFKIFAAG